MEMMVDFFTIPGNTHTTFRIHNLARLTGREAAAIREEVAQLLQCGALSVLVDACNTRYADLSGINEIIHSHYTAGLRGVAFIFVYRRNTAVENWVQATGLNRFVTTAVLPELKRA